jgi:hypothetical protein
LCLLDTASVGVVGCYTGEGKNAYGEETVHFIGRWLLIFSAVPRGGLGGFKLHPPGIPKFCQS